LQPSQTYPQFCPHPTEGRCCLFSHTWPLCREAVGFAAYSQDIKREILDVAPKPWPKRRRLVIDYDAEDDGQTFTFENEVRRLVAATTAVKASGVRVEDRE
jgi:hypothetical protein